MPDEVQEQIVTEEKQSGPLLPPEQTQDSSTETEETFEIPEDASERTKQQFNKLKEHNRQMAEQLKAKEAVPAKPFDPSVFDIFKDPNQAPVAPVVPLAPLKQDTQTNLVDSSGYLDEAALRSELAKAQDEARRAREESERVRQSVEQLQVSQQAKEAITKYPQLDPQSKDFNPNFVEAVRNHLVKQLMQSGKQDIVSAAGEVMKWFPTQAGPSQESLRRDEQARQTNLVGGGTSVSRGSSTQDLDQEELVRRTRMGDPAAINARLKNAGL